MKRMLFLLALCLVTLMSNAQTVAIVNYMKVPAGGGDAFLANEKEWKKIHQTRVNEGKMLGWTLFYVHNTGTDSPYNYVTVDAYENLEAALGGITVDEFKKAWGEKYNDVLKKTNSVRNLAYSETMFRAMGISSELPNKYMMVTSMKVNDNDRYYAMEEKAYMPIHQAAIDMGKLNSWSIWTRGFKNDNDYDVAAVNGFTSASQLRNMDYAAIMDKAKQGKSTNELMEIFKFMDDTEKIRTMVKTHLYEVVDTTTPKK